MTVYYITFRSITFAQRAERILNRQNIRCSIRRTPRWMEEQGCGYYLRIRHADIEAVLDLLYSQHISYKKMYVQLDNGEMQEVEL